MFRSLAVVGVLLAASCAGHPAPSPKTQAIVDATAQKHPNVSRLSVHALPAGETEYRAVASTSEMKRGTKSDPEDIRALETGEVVVRDEPNGIDVTVPILMKDGKYTATAGVTLKSASTQREAAVAEAKQIANEVAMAMEADAGVKTK